MKKITLNGKEYAAKEITFNMVCQLEEMGVPITDVENKAMSFIRAYLAICMGVKPAVAGAELEAHVLNGGSFEEINECIRLAVEGSGFFQAMGAKTAAQEE